MGLVGEVEKKELQRGGGILHCAAKDVDMLQDAEEDICNGAHTCIKSDLLTLFALVTIIVLVQGQ